MVGFCLSTAVLVLLCIINGFPVMSFLRLSGNDCMDDADISNMETVDLPHSIKGTNLLVERTVSYSGAFVEDLSFDGVTDIMALAVRNTGDQMIAEADIVLCSNEGRYHFSATKIPPGKAVLLLELERKNYQDSANFIISCSITEEPNRQEGQYGILAEQAGLDQLALTNCTNRLRENIQVYYKATATSGAYLLGGVTHCVRVPALKSGETIYIKPEHFARYHSQIIQMQ